jgi:hypothetical protein
MAAHVSVVKFLIPIPSPDAMLRTPYFTSIFQATAFWVGVTWIGRLVFGRWVAGGVYMDVIMMIKGDFMIIELNTYADIFACSIPY